MRASVPEQSEWMEGRLAQQQSHCLIQKEGIILYTAVHDERQSLRADVWADFHMLQGLQQLVGRCAGEMR